MQLLRRKPDYDLPGDFGQVISIVVNEHGALHALALIDADKMLRLREAKPVPLGRPIYASILHERLWFYPTPDDIYPTTARYAPAHKEF